MLRFAAALAAGVIMAGAASAQVWGGGGDCMSFNQPGTTYTVPIYHGISMPDSAPVSLPVIQRTCEPGWTMVTVGTVASHFLDVHKCAAVGDLRDPE